MQQQYPTESEIGRTQDQAFPSLQPTDSAREASGTPDAPHVPVAPGIPASGVSRAKISTPSLATALQTTTLSPQKKQRIIIPGAAKHASKKAQTTFSTRSLGRRRRASMVLAILLLLFGTALISFAPLGSGQGSFTLFARVSSWGQSQQPNWSVQAQVAHTAVATPNATSYAPVAKTGANLHASTTANGPYRVQGNKILDANGNQYLIHGIGRDDLEYNCQGDGYFDAAHLALMGAGTNGPNAVYWYANTVRLPLSEGFWLRGSPGTSCTAASYQALVKSVVGSLTAHNMNVMIDLHWTDAGGHSLGGGGPWAMPDADSVTFWTQVATIYKTYSNVMFEVYNEPHPSAGTWSCWLKGCAVSNDQGYSSDCGCQKTFSYTAVGMQALVNAVRGAGANNLAIVGGMNWGFDLSGVPQYTVTGGNVVYDTHPYSYSDKLSNTWDTAFGNISNTYAVVSAESGEYDCGVNFMTQLLNYLDAHQIGWSAWAWVSQGAVCTYPQLVVDYNGTPAPQMGVLIYQRLRSYANH
jgi:endoglucanase